MNNASDNIDVEILRDRIDHALCVDQYGLTQSLRRITKKKAAKDSNEIKKLLDRLVKSEKKVKQRKDALPTISYPKELPIAARVDEIKEAIRDYQVCVITGETGSGKTTQIPKICLAAGRGIYGKIACTQPRRIAATSLAARVSKELKTPLGEQVGFKIRFADKSRETSLIQFVTDGILLTEIQSDRFLDKYDTIIVDEAHERTLNIDFLLGYLRKLLLKRPGLKLIITSATIDVEKFSQAFPLIKSDRYGWILDEAKFDCDASESRQAPIIQVSGRSYPVEIRYRPIDETREEQGDVTIIDMAQEAIEELLTETDTGDILVFVSGIQEIKETTDRLDYLKSEGFWVLPLFSRLSASEQNRIFQSSSRRKIVVSTNIAETSITVPGIRYVVDTGRARISEYNTRSGTKGLPIKAISQSNANQRSGRCGRVSAGICIRLYSEDDYRSRLEYATPEIQRSDLAEVILRMLSMKLGSIQDFPFIDPPDSAQIRAGYRALKELGALTENGRLNKIGREIATLPVDPKTARMILQARKENALYAVLIIASAISCQDPKERPEDKQAQADQKHAAFVSKESDLISLLNLWEAYHTNLDEFQSQGKTRKFCKANFLSYKRIREWRDIHNQLSQMVRDRKWRMERPDNWDYDAIHRSILSGYLSNIAKRKEKKLYEGTKNRELVIFPGSGVYKNRYEWLVAIELIETSRLFAHRVANINVDWLEALGGDLCKKHWFEPHWDAKTNRVAIWEKVTLFGFSVVEKRKIAFGKINPVEATDVFIREALVDEQLRCDLPFWKHNQKLKSQIQEQENRQRKRNLLVDDYTIEKFYRDRLSSVSSLDELKKYIKRNKGDQFLRMTREDLLRTDVSDAKFLYPDALKVGAQSHKLTYIFDPDNPKDGVTITLPWSLIGSLKQEAFDYLVPGLLREKIQFLLKNLPKDIRKKLFPLMEIADNIWESMVAVEYSTDEATETASPGLGFYKELSDTLFKLTKTDISEETWLKIRLPDFLKMNFKTKKPETDKWIFSRSIKDFSERSADQKDNWNELIQPHSKTDVAVWDFENLLERVNLSQTGEIEIWGYRALELQDNIINLTVRKTSEQAQSDSIVAVARLIEREVGDELAWLYTELRFPPETINQFEYISKANQRLELNLSGKQVKIKRSKVKKEIHKELQNQVFEMVRRGLFVKADEVIRTRQAFQNRISSTRMELKNLGGRVVDWVKSTFAELEKINARLQTIHHGKSQKWISALKEELSLFFPPNCLDEIPLEQWKHCPRIMKCYQRRIEKWTQNPEIESEKRELFGLYIQKCVNIREGLDHKNIQQHWMFRRLLWMLEEYKVSIFAQDLKTAFTISAKRVDKFIQANFPEITTN